MARIRTTLFASMLVACGALAGIEELRFQDAGPEDGGPSSDGFDARVSNDAARADASDAGVCSEEWDFCDDFEGSRTLQGLWTGYGNVGPARLFIEAGVLRGEIARTDAGTGAYAALARDAPWNALRPDGVRKRVLVKFRGRIDRCPASPDPDIGFASLSFQGRSVDLIVATQASDCVASIREIVATDAGPVFRNATTLLFPVATWTDFELELFPVDGGTETLRLQVGAESRTFALTPTTTPTRIYHLFGAVEGNVVGTNASLALDDFRIVHDR
jgi:hypothetical protein